jgi:hypothetical protein
VASHPPSLAAFHGAQSRCLLDNPPSQSSDFEVAGRLPLLCCGARVQPDELGVVCQECGSVCRPSCLGVCRDKHLRSRSLWPVFWNASVRTAKGADIHSDILYCRLLYDWVRFHWHPAAVQLSASCGLDLARRGLRGPLQGVHMPAHVVQSHAIDMFSVLMHADPL